ncbi:MAG: transporter substrate-binding domain-containing protein [Lachnospiraceae bacterium]|nr:transporter substrate-binding domain-containing protein [Lachnospiraceae bacterium]
MRSKSKIRKCLMTLLLIATVICTILPQSISAKVTEHKVVRVGWFDSSFCYYDSYGRRCGIDYEYQQKISAYTGWTYEYVEDSWSNLLQMLKEGKIDLLSDVSYKPDREEYMYFTDLPMGTESYYVYVSADNRDITASRPASVNGKRIGVNKGSIQETFLEEWAEKNHLNLEIVPLIVEEEESMEMVARGELDGYATIFMYESEQLLIPTIRIGGSDYYYAVNKKRSDLLAELNMALAQIHDEDPYFIQKISEGRIYDVRNHAILTPSEEDYLREHGTIKIGYRNDYLPFCDKDEATGEMTGALKDYLAHALSNFNRPDIQFETIPFDSTEAALEALNAGEVDCIFPVNFSTYDADQKNIRLTDPAMKTEMYAILRNTETQRLSKDSEITLAVNKGMMNIETFIMEHYPKTKRESYEGLLACYKAVAEGKADCVLVSNYRIPTSEETLEKYKLFSVPTGEAMTFSFAVRKWDTDLYFILNKTITVTQSEDMDSALASYMHLEQKVSFAQFMKDNWIIVFVVLIVIFSIIIFLLVQKIRADRTANEQKRLLEEAEEVAKLKQTVTSLLDNMPGMNYTKDAETGAYLACNQAFADYAHKKKPEDVIGLTAGDIFDAEMVKRITEDDNMALSMDGPYVFYEDMRDASGVTRQIKTTKLKYVDANGRKCVLGASQDITDNVRITRGSVSNKEAYEKAVSTGIIFTHIAQALAHGYMELYYVDLNTEEFIEYRTDEEKGTLVETKRGWHFFEACEDDIEARVVDEDKEAVKKALDRRTLIDALDQNNIFMMTGRFIGEDGPSYVSVKVTRMQDDDRYVILGLMDINDQMQEHNAVAKVREEKTAYNRISALAGDFFCIYVVVPETGQYREFTATAAFDDYERLKEGANFFADARVQSLRMIHQEDQSRFVAAVTRENILNEVKRNGIFTLSYRLLMGGEPRYVQLKAALVEEPEGPRLIIGINDVDAQVRQEEEYGKRLAQARIEANIDALTGVKNRNAYRIYEERLNAQIEMNRAPGFAITILDVNDLKKVNDTLGHKAGDQYLRDACKIICTTFKRSPVFRVGGDEFAVLSQGDDYERIDELIEQMNAHNEEAIQNGGIVIAVGMARYGGEEKVAPIYERADQTMYENKSDLKARKKQ